LLSLKGADAQAPGTRPHAAREILWWTRHFKFTWGCWQWSHSWL